MSDKTSVDTDVSNDVLDTNDTDDNNDALNCRYFYPQNVGKISYSSLIFTHKTLVKVKS